MLVDREGRGWSSQPTFQRCHGPQSRGLERGLRLALVPSSGRHFPFCLRQPNLASLSSHFNFWTPTRLIALPPLSGMCCRAGVLRERGRAVICISVVIGA